MVTVTGSRPCVKIRPRLSELAAPPAPDVIVGGTNPVRGWNLESATGDRQVQLLSSEGMVGWWGWMTETMVVGLSVHTSQFRRIAISNQRR